MRETKKYRGPYPDPELSLYYRSLTDMYELLGQIYLQYPPLTIFGKEERWDGILRFYQIMAIISKRKSGIQIPFINRNIGNC